jgi:hypothetical protein
MERAAAGAELLVTHRGRPRIRVASAEPRLFAVAARATPGSSSSRARSTRLRRRS